MTLSWQNGNCIPLASLALASAQGPTVVAPFNLGFMLLLGEHQVLFVLWRAGAHSLSTKIQQKSYLTAFHTTFALVQLFCFI